MEEMKEEQTEFTIKLTGFDDSGKVKLIKEVKSLIEGMNLVQVYTKLIYTIFHIYLWENNQLLQQREQCQCLLNILNTEVLNTRF